MIGMTGEFGYDILTYPHNAFGGEDIEWCVAYDGRRQSRKEISETLELAESAGRALIAELKAQYCGHPCYLYPDASKWEIRIYDR